MLITPARRVTTHRLAAGRSIITQAALAALSPADADDFPASIRVQALEQRATAALRRR